MAVLVKRDPDVKNQKTFYYSEVEKEKFTQQVHQLLANRGYQLIQGDKSNGAYEKGNRILRILLGAFYKYFKLQLYIEFNGQNEAKLQLIKATSGFSGGAIGVSQVKKEFTNLEQLFTQLKN